MGCCFCCLSEADKVERVLEKFPPVPCSQAQDNQIQKLVGRAVLAGQYAFYAPASGNPCVYYKITVEEEYEVHEQDANGQPVTRKRWRKLVEDERFQDFYLQEGVFKAFIQASIRNKCKIQSMSSGGRSNIFQQPPPGVQQLIQWKKQGNYNWGQAQGCTGRYRYHESSFDVNELIAAVGVVRPSQDPYTGQGVKFIEPLQKNAIDEKWMEENGWEEWDIRSWQDLTEQSPSVLLSDNTKFTGEIQVQPVQELPAYMTQYDPNMAGQQWQNYQQ